MAVQGRCDPPFEKVKRLLNEFVESGEEVGASITVNQNGTNVVDIWGGYVDETRTRPWTQDTLVSVFSTTKTVTALACLILADEGVIDLNAKVSKYWPEFAANGKEDIEVRHLMSHTSGLAGWQEKVTIEDVFDQEKSNALLAAQAPWWKPGTASAYHAITMGNLLQEVIKRASGKTLTEVVKEKITGPLSADFYIGCPESEWHRIAKITPPPPVDLAKVGIPPESVAMKTLANPALDATWTDSEIWKRGEAGASNGHGNSRSVCRMLSSITLGGEVDGHKLLSPKTIERIWDEQYSGVDMIVGVPIRWGIGYAIKMESNPWLPKGRCCFWGGWGGSIVIMDLDRKLTIAYAMNRMGSGLLGSSRTGEYVAAIYEALSAS